MASNITTQSVLEQISQDHLECPICSGRFKQPKLLECSHSFCLECLQQLRKNSPSTTRLPCPVCTQETLINENGIDDLKTNLTVLSLIEAIETKETRLKQQQGKQVPSQEFVSKCSKHTGKDLIMYCETCKKLICTTCITKEHSKHPAIELNEASDKSKQHASELLEKISQSITTFNIAIQEIDTSRKKLDSMFAATKQKISKRADQEIAKVAAKIREEKQTLMQEAEQIYKDRVKTMETARATNSIEINTAELKQDEVNQLMDQQIKIVHHIEQLLQDLKEYREKKPTKNNKSLITIPAESNPHSSVIPQELLIQGITRPSSMTVNENDELIVLENETVNIFSRNYQLLHQFNPGRKPSCIAVDDINLIAVGNYTKAEISLHKPDGSLIKTLSAPGIGYHLTTYKLRLIYTNWDGNKLVSVTYNGGMVFSVDINQSGFPRGVCCDKDGSIYVAVWRATYPSSGDIHHYSPDGKYIGCIIKACGYPNGITITPAGDLVVATDKSVQIYQHE
ncbi:uncharacterized protein [Asterias amurensis]|uniref:uncharacterized protein n=1 Tax=Asterias amurensis TaxID=7602 RepID=UPI003AB21B1B